MICASAASLRSAPAGMGWSSPSMIAVPVPDLQVGEVDPDHDGRGGAGGGLVAAERVPAELGQRGGLQLLHGPEVTVVGVGVLVTA